MQQVKNLLDRARRANQQKQAIEKLVAKAKADPNVAAMLSDAMCVKNPEALVADTGNSLDALVDVIDQTVGAVEIPWPPVSGQGG